MFANGFNATGVKSTVNLSAVNQVFSIQGGEFENTENGGGNYEASELREEVDYQLDICKH